MPLRIAYSAFLLLAGFSFLNAQNGPGGVGTSANNVLWLDANRGLTLSGNNVTNWADQSGNSFNAVPSSSSAQPSLVTASANGLPSLKFDGTDDELWINDNAKLDLTQWHFFIVPKVNTQKDYNAWLTKGNDGAENYEILTYGDAHFHAPILFTDATRGLFDASSVLSTTTEFNVFEYSYSAAVGRDYYKNYSASSGADNENRTPATNNFSLYIGNEKSTTGRFANGNMAEIIMYNAPLNSAQRIIVNNYLAAKYNCTLTTNDLYTMDTPANGNFDYDVAGIGRVNATNLHSDAKGSGIVRILNPSGMGDGEYYFWGHDNGALGTYTTTDLPSVVQGRLLRVWRGSEVGTITGFDLQFDLSALGAVTTNQLRLLIDTNNDGNFADETTGGGGIINGATAIGGGVYQFANVTALNNGTRFTLGSTNISATPLPITLVDFNAMYRDGITALDWATATEKNNHHFTVERSQNGQDFELVTTVEAKGNSNARINYSATDPAPYAGLSYYRLKQTDVDGAFSYFDLVAVNAGLEREAGFSLFPNPSEGTFTIDLQGAGNEQVLLVISDYTGRACFSTDITAGDKRLYTLDPKNRLNPGIYTVTAYIHGLAHSKLVAVR